MYERVSSATHLKVIYPIAKSNKNSKFKFYAIQKQNLKTSRQNCPNFYTGEPFIPLKLKFITIHLLLIFTYNAFKIIYKECFCHTTFSKKGFIFPFWCYFFSKFILKTTRCYSYV